MTTPYRIEGPALISFSGGRTSAYMLWHILNAHDGKLPDDVHVCFANTGKEREETLRFVHECATRWGVRVRWLEWRPKDLVPERFEEVGYNSANRDGHWFGLVIDEVNILPNPLVRYCTKEMKIRTLRRFMRSLGYGGYANVVGLRADEMHRVYRIRESSDHKLTLTPMAEAGHTKVDVMAFWRSQSFDLGLRDYEGNCDLCFLKRRDSLRRLIRENPASADWWIAQEQKKPPRKDGAGGNLFRDTTSFAEIKRDALGSPLLPMFEDEDDYDAECGLACDSGVTQEDIETAADRLVAFAKARGAA